MSGFDLDEGQYIRRDYTDEELQSAIGVLFTDESKKDASYKYAFLLSLVRNFSRADKAGYLSFGQIFETFSAMYWKLVAVYDLRQKKATSDGRRAMIERVILDAKSGSRAFGIERFDELDPDLRRRIVRDVKKSCKRYVVGALYQDTRHMFYDFSKSEEYVKLNPAMVRYIEAHKDTITESAIRCWADFLGKVNPGVPLYEITEELKSSVLENA